MSKNIRKSTMSACMPTEAEEILDLSLMSQPWLQERLSSSCRKLMWLCVLQGVTDAGLASSPSVHLHKVDTVVAEMMEEGKDDQALAAIPAACDYLFTPPPTPRVLIPINLIS